MRVGFAAAILAASACGASHPEPEEPESSRAQVQDGGGAFAPDKGPAHATPLPAPGEQPWVYLDGEDTWRYVAPGDAGRLYDALYFDGRWFVLHGVIENSGKATLSEVNWLSWTRDGLTWETLTVTTTPFESYTRLASNGQSLLLAGTRHVAEFVDGKVVPIDALEQDTAPPVLIGHPDGYAIARRDDVLWIDRDRSIHPVYSRELAQFRAGVFDGRNVILAGPFNAIASPDGRAYRALAQPPCTGCNLVGIVRGNDLYLAADPETLFISSDGETWQAHVWERAMPVAGTPEDESGEGKIVRIDFTGKHFTLHTADGNTSLSKDGITWTAQLKIPLGQIGPAACNDRCVVAGGRLLLPPIVLDPEAPAGADVSSPYYCAYGLPTVDPCSSCGGATVAECREGVICNHRCDHDEDCPDPGSGNPIVSCGQTQVGGRCFLGCGAGKECPTGMTCSGEMCLYVFDNPRCTGGAP